MMTWGVSGVGWLGILGTLVFVAGVVLISVWAIQRMSGAREDEPMSILRTRFARGEISAEQFEEQRQALGAQVQRSAWNLAGLIGVVLIAAAVVAWILGSALGSGGWNLGRGIGRDMMNGALATDQGGPGSPGFVAGTAAAPRVVRMEAGPGYTFSPSEVRIVAGETITFEVTTIGPTVHEFKVGPAAEVAADSPAAPEIADIGMMVTKSVTYTFRGSGPFAFACHEPGHYEAGMRGVITIVP